MLSAGSRVHLWLYLAGFVLNLRLVCEFLFYLN